MNTIILFFFALVAAAEGADNTHGLGALKQIIQPQVSGLFGSADSNNNGEFDKGDMSSLFLEYDDNRDSAVSEAEFLPHFLKNEKGLSIVGKGLFLELDMDQSGSITDTDLDRYFGKLDINTDGHVSKIEFETYFTDLFTILYVMQAKQTGMSG